MDHTGGALHPSGPIRGFVGYYCRETAYRKPGVEKREAVSIEWRFNFDPPQLQTVFSWRIETQKKNLAVEIRSNWRQYVIVSVKR